MKAKFQYIILFTFALVFISACSLKKNTSTTRAYQALNTRYNVHFNGLVSYNEGLKNINTANREDYSTVIPMYPISKHDNANAAKSSMDRTIEKCRKAIKLHSIKQKPERDDKKWNNPDYQLWYKQEEFNPALKDAWLLLAQAEFHKGDFIGSVGTFTYISRHYSNDKDMVARCQLWTARAYGEMGWIYEAEQLLSKLKQDDLNPSHIGLLASVNADFLVKKHQYKEAIPFLELALKKENDKYLKQRFQFLLAQLYKITGNNKQAFEAFSNVIKLNPPFEMDFNARIYRAELDNEHVESVRKELNKMLKNSNNKEFLDQIYYTIGKTYLQTKDTAKAIDYFIESNKKSTRNGFDKAVTLITLGDLYYNKQNYIKAQPCYDEASKIITVENENYKRVSKLAETLGELVVQHDIIVMQDSLQYLSTLSEEKRLEIVNKIIAKLKADEKAAIEAEQSKNARGFNPEDELNNMPMIGPSGGMGNWYFYNPTILKSGLSDFQKRWGKRKLEDNWRRANKSSALFAEENTQGNAATTGENQKDSTKQTSNLVSDNKKPEYYLQQIPLTLAQIEKSNAELATALYNMGMIYKDKVEDFAKAIETFDEFDRRFPKDERRVETYFQGYMIASKQGNTSKADLYKNKLISDFPKSKYVEVISQPDYFDRMNRMYREQDSIYNNTYTAYNNSDFKLVKQNVEYIKKNYPLSTLMPKFMFLNALSVGKTDKPETFEVALNEVVEKYPESDVSAMSKDILSLIKQGREAKTGKSHGTLLAMREDAVKEEFAGATEKQFSTEKSTKHRLLIVTNADIKSMNKLLYNIAAYNFSSFIVKDFDLVTGKLDSIRNTLSVTNFDSYDEVQWYVNSLAKNPSLMSLFQELNSQEIIISEENYGILRSISGLDQYLDFQSKKLNGKILAENTKNIAVITKQEKTTKKTETKNEPIKQVTPTTKETLNKLDENALATATTTVTPPPAGNETTTSNKPIPVVENPTPTTKVPTTQPTQPVTNQLVAPKPAVVVPKEDEVPLFKNLFAYRANEPHFVSLAVLSGDFDYNKLKSAFDVYNVQNYSLLNLKLNKESVAKMQVIIIGPFADANVAKSYLFRMVKERSLFDNLKGTDYRNLIGSQKNLNIMMQQNAMSTYFEFMQQYYLK